MVCFLSARLPSALGSHHSFTFVHGLCYSEDRCENEGSGTKNRMMPTYDLHDPKNLHTYTKGKKKKKKGQKNEVTKCWGQWRFIKPIKGASNGQILEENFLMLVC